MDFLADDGVSCGRGEEIGREKSAWLLRRDLNHEPGAAVFPQQLLEMKEEQQEWSPSLEQEEPEPPHIKEEQEELWSSQEGEQLQGLEEADITKFPFTPVPVKSEDDEEKAQSSQLHQRVQLLSSHSSETDDSEDELREPGSAQSVLDSLKTEDAEKLVRYTEQQVLEMLQNTDEMHSDAEELNGIDIAQESDSDSGGERESVVTAGPVASLRQETARDGTVWVQQAACRAPAGSTTPHEKPGPTRYAKDNAASPLSSLLCLFDAEMWEHIRKCTIAEARRDKKENWDLSLDELKAFVGLLYLRGLTGLNDFGDCWSSDMGNQVFNETMSRQRGRDIMRYLRFDDKKTRAARLQTDKFAMMSEIWNKFVANSAACYRPGRNMTVDEQLFPTKTRCRFTQYVPNKPDKFGIKFWVAVDSDTKYVLNTFPFLGKDERSVSAEQLADSVLMRLAGPFTGEGRNITAGSLFVSMDVAKNLLAKQTTIVGAISSKRSEVPPSAQAPNKTRYSTSIWNCGPATLTVYQNKASKNICILSTMHRSVSVSQDPKKKPETVVYYNNTRQAVDAMDQLGRMYSVKAATRRWPFAVFYNLLDLAAVNAHVLFSQCVDQTISRRKFLLALSKELRSSLMATKAAAASVHILPPPPCDSMSPRGPTKRKKCQISRCRANKTSTVCNDCKRFTCGKCTGMVVARCIECWENSQ